MRRLILIICSVFFALLLFAQKDIKTNYPELKILSSKQQIELSSLPELEIPMEYKYKSVPYEVDNTVQTCYSGLFQQAGLCCGQAACVGNAFTYEINRIRDLDGTLTENKYPTHFAWNWENGGEGYYGASYYHSMLLLKHVGIPDMVTYGGAHDTGGDQRFMSGYDNYYSAMQNRLNKAYAINCTTEDGIMALKHWINDHVEGADVGGIGIFYSQHQNPSTLLPAGTEHEGEKVCVTWGASPNHAMTITGYNDSIKWDYNGDGQYTNDVDITGDGIVDVKDWEIGAFKMCNTYGSPYNGWMMYKSLAMPSNQGGIWNNTVNVLYAVDDYSPALTYKVNLYYTNRGRIKILAGVSTDLSASEPDHYLTFPIFDYQGSELGMQGENDEVSRQIEFGLDVSPFLSLVSSGTPIKLFFQIHENDDEGWGTGQIQSFSVIDYTSGSPVEIISTDVDVEIIHNGVTTVSTQLTPTFEQPEITTVVLPNANVYNLYEHQMLAESGTPPYRWEFDIDYQMTEVTTPLADATTTLGGSQISLPFDFPFYGETYSSFLLDDQAYIDFSGEPYGLPYNSNDLSSNTVSFYHRKCIAPFFTVTSCDVYYASGADYYIIRWVGDNIDVSLQLESDGNITIFYNNCTPENNQVWSSGFSLGNLTNYSLTPVSGATTTISSVGYQFTPLEVPEIFEISEDGLLSGTPEVEMLAYPLNFKVTDAKGFFDRKTIPISTEGLIIGYDISTLNNNLIEWGENVDMELSLRNATDTDMTNLVVSISCDNTDVTINDDTEDIGTLSTLQELNIVNAFDFDLNFNFYNEQEIVLHLTATCDQNTWDLDIVYPVYTADIVLGEYFVDDSDNNRLDIGETSDVYYVFSNDGGAGLENAQVSVSSSDPFLSINDGDYNIGDINSGHSDDAYFNFTASPTCLPGHVAILDFYITGANGFEINIEGYVSIGQILENWETATLDTYSWTNSGDLPWDVSDVDAHEGAYCLKSGAITHDQNSTLEIDLQVIAPGNISFYRKVSCENHSGDNYDYLVFYIDGMEKARWDSIVEWGIETFPVSAGVHNFQWVYHKDGSVSTFEDCAWIDYIEFPSIYDAEPMLTVSVTEINKSMYPNETDTESIFVSNQGGGIITYDIEIFNDLPWLRDQRNVEGSYMTCSESSFNAGDTVDWFFTAKNMSPDNEWVEEVMLDFPSGFEVLTIGDMYDQSDDTLHVTSGEPGDGSFVVWFGENADGWGLITVNEIATAEITGVVNLDFEGNMAMRYVIQGEVYASEPHSVTDSIVLTNYGPPIEWITTENTSGAMGIGDEDEIVLNFSSIDLNPGDYNCNVNIYASSDTVIVPVILTVEDPLKIDDFAQNNVSLFPNPAHNELTILCETEMKYVEVIDILGQVVFQQEVKSNSVKVNIESFVSGSYFVKVYTEEQTWAMKLIVE